MTKIVYNACHGGFGLSEAAMLRYAKIKGITLYPERGQYNLTTYWVVPLDKRLAPLEGEWRKWSIAQRARYNREYAKATLHDKDIARTDPALVQVVEELGAEASDKYREFADRGGGERRALPD